MALLVGAGNIMKLYITTYDSYDDQLGSSICSLGVFDTYDRAEKALKINGVDFLQIDEVNLNEATNLYLGGYIE